MCFILFYSSRESHSSMIIIPQNRERVQIWNLDDFIGDLSTAGGIALPTLTNITLKIYEEGACQRGSMHVQPAQPKGEAPTYTRYYHRVRRLWRSQATHTSQ